MATETQTVKTSGGNYTSLAAWEAQNRDLTTETVQLTVECYAMTDTAAVDIYGWQTNSSWYIHITVPTSERHAGAWDDNKYNLTTPNTVRYSLRVRAYYTRLSGLQIRNTRTQAASCAGRWEGNYYNYTDACIFEHTASGASNAYAVCYLAGGPAYFWNCVFKSYNTGTTEIVFNFDGSTRTFYLYNCTFITTDDSARCLVGSSSNSTFVMKNCYAASATAGNCYQLTGTTLTMVTCASSDTTGSNGLQNIAHSTSTFVSVTGSGDYHLVVGSPLRDVGTDTTGDSAPLNFTVDIDGAARNGSWDIGADDYFTALATGHPALKRLGGIPGAAVNQGVW